jgi:uncharacterized protein (TIGR02246 family)
MEDPKRIANQVADAYMAAAAALDVDGFMSLYDPGARVFDLWTTWSYDGSTAWRDAVEAWFESVGAEQVVVTFDDVRAVGSGDVIVAHGFVGYAATADGVPQRAMTNRLTWVLIRHGHDWRIVHEHTSAPIDESNEVILER